MAGKKVAAKRTRGSKKKAAAKKKQTRTKRKQAATNRKQAATKREQAATKKKPGVPKAASKRKAAARVQPTTLNSRPSTLDPRPAKRVSKKRPAFNPKTDSANDPAWVAPVWEDDVLLGAHVSIAGGTHEAPPRARAIGASAMQIFTKMANRWADRSCETDECTTFVTALAETRVHATVAHDSYLINLAS